MISIAKLYELYLDHPVVSTDTRTITPGCIFFALKGGNFNGNAFAQDALDRGAAYAVVDEKEFAVSDRFLRVENVLNTLQDVAALHRKKLGEKGLRVIALTGSNGKTTTKELVARVLSSKFKVLATQGNLNNHIGVPLTLLRLTADHEIAVIEMGANHLNEIAELCRIADPDYGLITNIGLAHLEGFGGVEGVFKGKTELLHHLEKKNGFAFLLEDEVRLHHFKSKLRNLSYGTSVTSDVQGAIFESTLPPSQLSPVLHVNYEWHTEGVGARNVHTQMIGSYNLPNMLAATAVGIKFGVDPAKIDEAISNYIPDNHRSQFASRGTNKLILDYYNANPSSMIAAIENMAVAPAKNKMLILGDMFELGDTSIAQHQHIVNVLMDKVPEAKVILVGRNFHSTIGGDHYLRLSEPDEAKEWLEKHKPHESLILIKGSRGMKMEVCADAIL